MPYALTTNESRRLMRLAVRLSQPLPAGSVLAHPAIAEEMLQLFNADFIGSTRWNADTASFEGALCVGRDADMADQYLRHFQFIDPISPVLRRRRGASHIYAGMPRDELLRTAYFNEFLKPFRTVEGVDLYVYRGQRNVGDLRVWRAAGRKPLGEREITLLNLLQPYLLDAMLVPSSRPVPLERFGLTPREAQICELLVKGMTDREIGRLLRLGYWTVRTHLQHVFAKLEVSNRVELTHRLLANG
jgi:DNA-binding CsgD family transcriptional regulator